MTHPTDHLSAAAAGTVTLGSDLMVNRLGFGAMRLTGPGIWGEPRDPAEARRVLRRAVELDVNFIDTADAYGPEVSERLIAEALYPYPDNLVIATKGGNERPGPGEWVLNGRPEHLREALEGSLRRLRLDHIDLYYLHSPDPHVPFAESVGALADLQREGKIRHIGLSNVNLQQLVEAQTIATIASVQNRFSVVYRSSEEVLDACADQNLAFLPWLPLDKGGPQVDKEISEIAEESGVTPAQLALAWLLRRSPVMLPIPGTSSVAHLGENIAAAGIVLNQECLEALRNVGNRATG